MIQIPRKYALSAALAALTFGTGQAAIAQASPYTFIFTDGGDMISGLLDVSVNNSGMLSTITGGYATLTSVGTVQGFTAGQSFTVSPAAGSTTYNSTGSFLVSAPHPQSAAWDNKLNTTQAGLSGGFISGPGSKVAISTASTAVTALTANGFLLTPVTPVTPSFGSSSGQAIQLYSYSPGGGGGGYAITGYSDLYFGGGGTVESNPVSNRSTTNSFKLTAIPEPAFYQSGALAILSGGGLITRRLRRLKGKAVAV